MCPESAEVKIITTQLNNLLQNSTLCELKPIGGRYRNGLFIPTLPLQILSVNCKGKFIHWELENDWYIFNTLGMTGEFSFIRTSHSALEFTLQNSSIPTLYFNDIRHFGTFAFHLGQEKLQTKLDSLGPDMLHSPPLELFSQRILKQRKTITESLMNQKVISGVGNYIKAEALYLAKISPWRLSSSLSSSELQSLHSSIIAVIHKSLAAGGNTLKNYKDIEGKIGSFSKDLLIYKKSKDPEGRTVIAEETPDKRTTHWVPGYQL